MIRLSYIDHISPYGVMVRGVGRIHSPILSDIFKMGYYQYQRVLTLFLYTPEKYFTDLSTEFKTDNPWNQFTNEQKNNLTMFGILTSSDEARFELISGLALFVSGDLEWDEEHQAILINKEIDSKGKMSVGGFIDKSNYKVVVQVILQLLDISVDDMPEESPKFRSEKDRLFWEKFQAKKKIFAQNKKADPNFELPNMISLLCTFHPSLNYSNIFNLTIGQIRDTFSQLLKAKQLNIAEMNYSVWGGKYDPSQWVERIDKENENIGG